MYRRLLHFLTEANTLLQSSHTCWILHASDANPKLTWTLQVLGVKSITFMDIIDRHILPAFKSDQAYQLPPDMLVSYLAFISLSGLLSTSKFDAIPDTAQGKKLLKQLQRCAVIHTNRGAMQVASSKAIHLPVSLGNQVQFLLWNTVSHPLLFYSDFPTPASPHVRSSAVQSQTITVLFCCIVT